jgi:hypothetical protein
VNERQQLAAGPGGAGTLTKVERLVHDPLDPEPIRQPARQNKSAFATARSSSKANITRSNPRSPPPLRLSRTITISMTPWAHDPRLPTQPVLPAQEVILRTAPDTTQPRKRWIEA